MGSALQSCCGESSKQSKPTIKKCQVETPQKKIMPLLAVMTQGQINFTQLDILKILGQLIKVQTQITVDDFEIQGILGLGAFGTVYLAQLKSNIKEGKIQKYAVKRIAKQLLIQKNLMPSVIQERDVLAMSNKFLVSLIMAFQDAWYLYLVMEYAAGGDTYSLIKPGSYKIEIFKNLGENGVRFISACVIEALEFLHQNQYMYRDLKPQNVLIFDNGYAKLTDFGLVKKSVAGKKNQTISGTEFYFAPEMVLTKGYGKQIDFWAVGIYLYQLSNYEPPFEAETITKANFQQACLAGEKQRQWFNPNLSEQLKDLINSLLKYEPGQRLGAKKGWQQVKSHKFYNGFDWQALESGTMQSPLKKIVDMFPASIKPFRPEIRQTESEQTRVEGWSLVKKKTI